jgi:D-alanyl-lipoteichoic acid acyltransferase DltB (MBOAT superfamily)
MSFTSPGFFLFFLVYFLGSLLLSRERWLLFAALASSYFYAFWDWRFLLLLYYVVTVSWFVGVRLNATQDETARKRYVTLSVVSCLSVLAVFKYFDFFVGSFTHMAASFGLQLQPRLAQILLPIGISFYTFHALSYTIDLYRRKLSAPAGYLTLVVYLAFFPQLVAGPIVRAQRFLPQIERGPVFSPRKIKSALLLIAWGYFLKVCVADSIAPLVDPIFAAPGNFQSGQLLFTIVAYSFQIYCDFAGYSLIAIGLAKTQGFDFPANFLAPYFSSSFSEFWRRWHISLSSFLRDYLYIPLGGNRHGRLREDRNVMVTMFLGGLWHGASYNFIVWGLLHGFYLLLQRWWKLLRRAVGWPARPRRSPSLSRPPAPRWAIATMPIAALPIAILQIAGVYALVCLAWVFFRLHRFDYALLFLQGLARLQALGDIFNKFQSMKVMALIALTLAVDLVFIRRRNMVRILRSRYAYALAIALLLVTIEMFGSFGGGAFIYFQF